MTITIEMKKQIELDRELEYLEGRRERINSRRDSKGELVRKDFEDMFLNMLEMLEELR